MCVPKTPAVVTPATDVPSMQAASSLSLANQDSTRGAAQLGRLALRIGGGSSAQSTSSAATALQANSAAPPAAAPVAASTVAANPSNLASAAPYAGVGSTPGALAGLRFGNFTGATFI